MAQKNLLKYILIGLLENEKKTGYDLKKLFETEIGEFWSAKHSQIYLELKRLEEQGYIASETGLFGNKIEKTYYTVTEKGRRVLNEWEETPTGELPINKDEFILKLYFIHNKNDKRIKEMLSEQYRLHASKLFHLQERMKLLFKDEISRTKNYGHFLILDLAIRREQEYIGWIKQYLY
ncbi:DNA-binding transcriptional regulator, PadR family [Anaerocolumna jejuensis DSM 15929]|uniref:DNA-binding transcriptional regulator, PadR family n=1 Tax=Anaerocolumna jejuensis DSM 15929 TaxID=1121322 RepID=A0A1M7CIN7_9FIRM|nr:PadR family transcriptional regulator [Anaerocolumna jejuensis]SHL67064.1 DNA-binding transcriptional regulator, PadR family [Anaerocolumna jejuensis DSM 15929]